MEVGLVVGGGGGPVAELPLMVELGGEVWPGLLLLWFDFNILMIVLLWLERETEWWKQG